MAILDVTDDASWATQYAAAGTGDTLRIMDAASVISRQTISKSIIVRAETRRVPVCRGFLVSDGNVEIRELTLRPAGTLADTSSIVSISSTADSVIVDDNDIGAGNPNDSYNAFDPTDDSLWPVDGGGKYDMSLVPDGIGSGGGSGSLSCSLTVTNNDIHDVNAAVKFGSYGGAGTSLIIKGNDIRRFFDDSISFIFGSGAPNFDTVHICGNKMGDNIHGDAAKWTDGVGPHSDGGVQFGLTNLAIPAPKLLLIGGNVQWLSATNTTASAQRYFLSDQYAAGGYGYNGAALIENFGISRIQAAGILCAGSGIYAYRNTLLATPSNNVGANISYLRLTRDDVVKGKNFCAQNIAESITADPYLDYHGGSNIVTGLATGSTSYDTWFDTPAGGWDAVLTPDDTFLAYTPKTAYAAYGAAQPGETMAELLDAWANDTAARWATMPSYVGWRGLISQALSTQLTSEYAYVHAGGTTRAISISAGGEYQVADDKDGTNAGAWTSTGGTVAHGKWVRLRRTTSASYSTTTTTTLTIGSETFDWVLQTLSNIPFPTVAMPDNVNIGYTGTAAGAANQKATLAIVFKATQASSSSTYYLWGDSGNVYTVRVRALSTGKLRISANDASNVAIISGNWDCAQNVDTTKTYLLLVSMDTSDATKCKAQAWDLGGTSHLTWGTPTLASANGIGFNVSAVRRLNSGSSGLAPHIDMAFFAIGYWLDATDASNVIKFTAGNIGPAGEGPFWDTLADQPDVFICGNAAAFNDAGGINLGTNVNKYVRSAASMTDFDDPQNPWPPVLDLVAEVQTAGPYYVDQPIDVLVYSLGFSKGVNLTADNVLAGAWADDTQALPLGSNGVVFTYTPTAAGSETLSFTNDGSYNNPAGLELTIEEVPEEGGGEPASFFRTNRRSGRRIRFSV